MSENATVFSKMRAERIISNNNDDDNDDDDGGRGEGVGDWFMWCDKCLWRSLFVRANRVEGPESSII